jgi:hypothetical protein
VKDEDNTPGWCLAIGLFLEVLSTAAIILHIILSGCERFSLTLRMIENVDVWDEIKDENNWI